MVADSELAPGATSTTERLLAPAMVYAFDARGVCTLAEGPGLARIGLTREQLLGSSVRELFAAQPAVLANVDRALAGQRVRNVTVVAGVDLDTFIEPQFDGDGCVVGAFGASVDVTEARAHERQLAYVARRDRALASISALLAADTADVGRILEDAAVIVGGLLGGFVVVWTLNGDSLTPSAYWHRDPAKRALVEEYIARAGQDVPLRLAATTLDRGMPEALSFDQLDVLLPAHARQVRAEAGVEGIAHAPVVARGETLGVLAVYREPEHGTFDEDDLSMLGEVAGRLGMAIANARLLDELTSTNEDLLKFRALADASGDFIGILGVDGRVAYVNPAGRRLAGLPVDGDETSTELPNVLAPQTRALIDQMCRGEPDVPDRWDADSWIASADGRQVPVAASAFALQHPVTGKPMGVGTVQRDLTEQRRVEAHAQQLSVQRQALLARQAEAVEAERARIAADVHDDSIQVLAAVDLRLGLLRRRLRDEAPEHLDLLDRLHADIQAAVARLRELLFDLEAPARDLGLGDALRDAADRAFEDSGITWTLVDSVGEEMPQPVRTAAYRICQEALANVRRHSGARHVRVSLAVVDDGLLLEVADDGCGIEAEATEPRVGHLGLAGMRERAHAAGGLWRLESSPGAGTTVSAWLPLVPPATRELP